MSNRTTSFEDEEQVLFNADRWDCLKAQQERSQKQPKLSSTTEFATLESIIEKQNTQNDSDTELIELCSYLEQNKNKAPNNKISAANPENIVEIVLRDFCSSPSYEEEEEEDLPFCQITPYFRFRNKQIKTYCRKLQSVEKVVIAMDEDERMSCSSDLSVQEDHNTSHLQSSSITNLDLNSSHRICENLLNLSAFFSQPATTQFHNPQIDLPLRPKADCDSPIEGQHCDIEEELTAMGYSFESEENFQICLADISSDDCNSRQSDSVEVKGSNLAQENSIKSLNSAHRMDNNRQSATADDKEFDEWFNDECSFFENFNTQNDTKVTENATTNAAAAAATNTMQYQSDNDIPPESNLSEDITAIEVPEIVEFRTASNKEIVVSPETRERGMQLWENVKINEAEFYGLGDVPISEWQSPASPEPHSFSKTLKKDQCVDEQIPENVVFRTASNKDITISEETKQRGIKLMADAGIANEPSPLPIKYSQANFTENTEKVPELIAFRTASNKAITISEETRLRGMKFLAEVFEEKEEKCTDDIPETVAFRTASDKCIVISESACKRASNIFNELRNVSISQPSDDEIFLTPKCKKENNDCPFTPTQQHNETVFESFDEDSPTTSQESKRLLSQLVDRSPLDKAMKSSIVARRHLLSLNKRRLLRNQLKTTVKKFSPLRLTTSTPLQQRNMDLDEDLQRIPWEEHNAHNNSKSKAQSQTDNDESSPKIPQSAPKKLKLRKRKLL